MWKLIIILVLLLYLLNKVSMIIFRLFGRPQPPPFRGSNHHQNPAAHEKPQKKGGLKGGEYVDYEEVK